MKNLKDTMYGDIAGETFEGDVDIKTLPIETLEGSPEIVNGDFICTHCKNLETLEGSPKVVEGDFTCTHCKNLETLKGAPETVNGNFNCNSCDTLKDLKGAPETVGGNFNCTHCKNLETLEGAPRKCEKFNCSRCPKLKSLDPLLLCDIKEVKADKHLLEDYNKKKRIIYKYGYEQAKEIIEMMNNLI